MGYILVSVETLAELTVEVESMPHKRGQKPVGFFRSIEVDGLLILF